MGKMQIYEDINIFKKTISLFSRHSLSGQTQDPATSYTWQKQAENRDGEIESEETERNKGATEQAKHICLT